MKRFVLAITSLLMALTAVADQFKDFDGVEVHYAVVNTLFLQPGVAARYGVAQGKDRAIVSVAVLDRDGAALSADVTGETVNLLSTRATLQFSRFREGGALYHIAQIRYTDQDVLRFRIAIDVPGRAPMHLEFQQRMYVDPS